MSAATFAALMADLCLGWAMTHPGPVIAAVGAAGTGGVLVIARGLMARDDMPLTFAEQADLDVITSIERPDEIRPEPPRPARSPARHARPPAWRRAALAGKVQATVPAHRPAPGRRTGYYVAGRDWPPIAPPAIPTEEIRRALEAIEDPAPTTGDGPSPVRAVTPTGPGTEPSAAAGPAPCPPSVPGRDPGETRRLTADGSPLAVHAQRGGDPGIPAGDTPPPPREADEDGQDEEGSIYPHRTNWYSLPAIDAAIAAGELRDQAEAGVL